jgi:hypothetical protein
MWAALRMAVEVDDRAPGADGLREEIVRAAGLRPVAAPAPTAAAAVARLSEQQPPRPRRRPPRGPATLEHCFDERGALYEVPAFVLRDPDNLIEDPDASHREPVCAEFKDAAAVVAQFTERSAADGRRRLALNAV